MGPILYEMLSGVRAFHRDSAAETMSAILSQEPPDLSGANENVPPGLDRIVRHCLEKNAEERFHSTSDIAFDLEALSGSGASESGQEQVVDRRLDGEGRSSRRPRPLPWRSGGMFAGHGSGRPRRLASVVLQADLPQRFRRFGAFRGGRSHGLLRRVLGRGGEAAALSVRTENARISAARPSKWNASRRSPARAKC